jgi:hypothetical protein
MCEMLGQSMSACYYLSTLLLVMATEMKKSFLF